MAFDTDRGGYTKHKHTHSNQHLSQAANAERRDGRTFADFDALHGLVVHRAGAGLEQLVALDAQIVHLRALDAERDELLHHVVHDFRRGLLVRGVFMIMVRAVRERTRVDEDGPKSRDTRSARLSRPP